MKHRTTLLALMAFFFVFWFLLPLIMPQTQFVLHLITLPFRHLGIFVHEMGHGLFTLLSGGRFHWFQMELMKGGVAVTSGGIRVFTLLGGLLGPALFGALLLRASTRSQDTRWAFWGLTVFFAVGVFYMFKPLFLASDRFPMLAQWHAGMLVSALVPAGAGLITMKVAGMAESLRRFYLQVLGILMCYSGFSDTQYIFYFPRLENGLYSDVRVLTATFWPSVETVPYPLFLIVALLVSGLNFALMFWGVAGALRVREQGRGEKTSGSPHSSDLGSEV